MSDRPLHEGEKSHQIARAAGRFVSRMLTKGTAVLVGAATGVAAGLASGLRDETAAASEPVKERVRPVVERVKQGLAELAEEDRELPPGLNHPNGR